MIQGEHNEVKFIASSFDVKLLYTILTQDANTEIKQRNIPGRLKVILEGNPQEFDITLHGADEVQIQRLTELTSEQTVEWTWDVIPRQYGQKKLYLRAVAIENQQVVGDFHKREKDVNVKLSYSYVAKRAIQDPRVLGGLSISGIGAALWAAFNWLRKRRRKPKIGFSK